MKIEINTDEEIRVVAVGLAGWGRGKTIAEALRNLKNASRGLIKKNYTMELYPDGGKKKVVKDVTDMLHEQQVRLWLTNDEEFCSEWYTFLPRKGKWAIFLGDEHNAVKAYMGNRED